MLPEYSKEDICYSIILLKEAGLIIASIQFTGAGLYSCLITRLTFEGHEYLEKIRDDNRWSDIKKASSAVRNYSLAAINTVAEGITAGVIQAYLSKTQ